ncbi:MAG: NfeD family protein [Deltaproteobacteria bacterium]|nr:NfeD family protein [Deltaproteobacteria bacterium]
MWVWFGLGALLLVAELVMPGLVVVFLGAAALLVAGLLGLGVIDSLVASVIAWMGLSVGLTLSLRSFLVKRLPSESRRALTEEAIQSFGAEVQVLELINENDSTDRIRYQGTTWPAISTHGEIRPGEMARLVARQNLAWLVERVPEALAEKNGD